MSNATELQVPLFGITANNPTTVTFTVTNLRKQQAIPLSSCEIQILALSAQDKSTKEISKVIWKSPRTIETIRQHIKEKLQVSTIAGMIAKAIYLKIILPAWKPIPLYGEPIPVSENLEPSWEDSTVTP